MSSYWCPASAALTDNNAGAGAKYNITLSYAAPIQEMPQGNELTTNIKLKLKQNGTKGTLAIADVRVAFVVGEKTAKFTLTEAQLNNLKINAADLSATSGGPFGAGDVSITGVEVKANGKALFDGDLDGEKTPAFALKAV